MEKALQRLMHQLKKQVSNAVSKEKLLKGVKILSGTPCCATVRLSALDKMNLGPSTYLPSAQADAVKRRLEHKQTVQSIVDELHNMIETRAVRFSDGERVAFNQNTIDILVPYAAWDEDAKRN
ncbi:MAG: hypothetical protein IJN31_00485 [Peptococcaceae bacterium]|nr:hypothetical protein [Peptococcaceae bacterium]